MSRAPDGAAIWRRPRRAPEDPVAMPHDELVQKVVVDPLSRPAAAPDLTDSIMHRLGYVRRNRREVRRAAAARWAQRAGLAAMALVAVYAASQVHSHLPQARRPSGPTLPAALQTDFRRHEQQLHQFIDRIRQLAPRAGWRAEPVNAVPPPPPPESPESPASPASPVTVPAGDAPAGGSDSTRFDDAPFRWA